MPHDLAAAAPFEGPEKLLELWFAPSASVLDDRGLRNVDRKLWEGVLDIVKCKILSVVHGTDVDAYLLSESSLFVSPHRLILKTCGTTLNLLGLPRILEIAATYANLPHVYRCFYSRKSFMFPDRQHGPHRDWKQEVEFLDNLFFSGAAYTVGKVNGDHWLLYLTTNPTFHSSHPSDRVRDLTIPTNDPDYTIEILMSDLSPATRDAFMFPRHTDTNDPFMCAKTMSNKIGITNIFPPDLTTLDAYAFTPCGYSANALIRWDDLPTTISVPNDNQKRPGEGYYTIHVTPEPGWSYASFECNVPLTVRHPSTAAPDATPSFPDLKSLVKRVVSIFRPARLTVTLFISRRDNGSQKETEENISGVNAVEVAQRAFHAALTSESSAVAFGGRAYKRTDKINYEFGGYDLAFATFEV
ncbi:hypothetical protein AX15_005968 [Amanita polypyramis BW_CC]|nr:hypothetical protein AX15_005968 [Amanita polypyramis BW_CC]